MTTTRRRLTGWHRGGPWPGWIRWWYASGGPARDARIARLYLELLGQGNLRPGQQVADAIGCSRSTVHRALIRHGQRIRGQWPPKISNGFGESAAERRALRLRQLGLNPHTEQPIDPSEESYQPPGQPWEAGEDS